MTPASQFRPAWPAVAAMPDVTAKLRDAPPKANPPPPPGLAPAELQDRARRDDVYCLLLCLGIEREMEEQRRLDEASGRPATPPRQGPTSPGYGSRRSSANPKKVNVGASAPGLRRRERWEETDLQIRKRWLESSRQPWPFPGA